MQRSLTPTYITSHITLHANSTSGSIETNHELQTANNEQRTRMCITEQSLFEFEIFFYYFYFVLLVFFMIEKTMCSLYTK